jgi:hypothetical protein
MSASNITTFSDLTGTTLTSVQQLVDATVSSRQIQMEDGLRDNLRNLKVYLSSLPGGDEYISPRWHVDRPGNIAEKSFGRKIAVTIEGLNGLVQKQLGVNVDLASLLNEMEKETLAEYPEKLAEYRRSMTASMESALDSVPLSNASGDSKLWRNDDQTSQGASKSFCWDPTTTDAESESDMP